MMAEHLFSQPKRQPRQTANLQERMAEDRPSDRRMPTVIRKRNELEGDTGPGGKASARTHLQDPGATGKPTSQSITRRTLGLNTILGLGGFQGLGRLTGLGPRHFATPVVLQPTVPEDLWGTWLYKNQASAIEMIVEQLQLDIRLDATGSVTYAREVTEFQDGCVSAVLAQWPEGNWRLNGQQLIFTGAGTEEDRYTCNPAQNITHPVGSTLIFSSYQVT